MSIRNITLLLASTLMILSGAAIAPALPAIAQAFANVSGADFWVHQILTLTGLSVAIAAPLIGRYLDKSDPRHLFLLSLGFAGITGSVSFFYPDSLLLLIASRLLLGIAVAGVMVSFTLLIAGYFSGGGLDRMLGLQAGVGAYAAVAYLLVGGLLAEVHWSWAFLLFLMPLLLIIPAWKTLDKVEPAAPPPTDAANPEVPSRALQGMYALGLVEAMFLYWLLVHIPFHLQAHLPISASGSGVAIAGMMLTSALIAGRYQQLRGEKAFALLQGIAFIIFAVGLSLLAAGTSVVMLTLGLLLSGVSLGLLRPNIMRWLLSLASPATRGQAVGLFTSAFFIGQFLSAPIAEPVISLGGRSLAFGWAALLAVLLGIGLLWLGIRHTQAASPDEAIRKGA